MKRSTRISSVIFRDVLKQAEEQLALTGRAAANFQHRGIRGDERANAVRQFFADHLPNTFATGKGECIDFKDSRTGQLDFCIFDAATASPIWASEENCLIPAEALYVVVEVKSTLTREELVKCVGSATKVRALRPFKEKFIASPTKGAVPTAHRCLYIVFAYESNLSTDNWAQKEFDRLREVAAEVGCSVDVVDRIIVLDRGMIRSQVAAAMIREETKGVFLEFYLHVVNFLTRERNRRPEIDWTAYTSKSAWQKLT